MTQTQKMIGEGWLERYFENRPMWCMFSEICANKSYKCNYYFCRKCETVVRHTEALRDFETHKCICAQCGGIMSAYCVDNKIPDKIKEKLDSAEIAVTERLTEE